MDGGKGMMTTEDFRELERRDEEQILAEMEGKYLDEFVYQFQQGGRTVTGLSWAGIKEIAYRMGHITVDLERLEEKETHYVIIVKATDTEKGNSRLGISTQPKTMKRRTGPDEEDQFALQKAMSKAQRNAMRSLMPEEMLKTWISRFLTGKTQGKPPERKKVPSEVSTPRGEPFGSVEAVEQYLAEHGVDVSLLDFEDGGSAAYVTPKKYMGDLWGGVNDVVRAGGGEWIKEEDRTKKSYWNVPKVYEPDPEPEEPVEAPKPSLPPLQAPNSMDELDYILNDKFLGARELFTIIPNTDEFTVEPTRSLDEELVMEMNVLAERMGGERRLKPGSLTEYVWRIPKGEEG